MTSLSNPYLDFCFDANTAAWSLKSKRPQPEMLCLEQVRLGATFRDGAHRLVRWEGEVSDLQITPPALGATSPHGSLQTLAVQVTPRLAETRPGEARAGLRFKLEFALPESLPFLLWRATVYNRGGQTVTLEVLDLAVTQPRFAPPAPVVGKLAFFANGYQSWSFAGALRGDLRQPASGLGPFSQPLHLNLVTPRSRRLGHFVSDMFGVLGEVGAAQGVGVVAGFIAQREQFGHVKVNVPRANTCATVQLTAQCDGVTLAPGEERVTDWAYLQFIDVDEADPLEEYVEAVARENQARVPTHTPVGWCSWYHYFDKVTEQDITSNLEAIVQGHDKLPLDFIQIDDGYQTQVGDWFGTKPTFASGLKWLTDRVRANGHTPGVWLAPYMVRSDAQLWRDHPDWLLRGADSRPVNAGLVWFKWCYGLDPTHPGVREHTRRLITTAVREWGFPYLKLDFLYAAALPAQRRDPKLTRAQAMRLALTDIREAAGAETFLLGCGCPLGSAVGMVDGMRISADVAPDWHPQLISPLLAPLLRKERELPSARNAIQNVISRGPFHRRWWLNDPDCLLARDHNTRLTEAEVCSLATVIALSGGMFLVSDDMAHLNPARLRYLTPLLPMLTDSARAPGWMRETMPETLTLPLSGAAGEWLVAGLFNWQDAAAPRGCTLPSLGLAADADYWVADFWEGKQWKLTGTQRLAFPAVPPHGAHLVAIRRIAQAPALVASSFHFSQGKEIKTWQVSERELNLTLELGRVAEGELRLALPSEPLAATVDGRPASVRPVGPSLYALACAVRQTAEIRVTLG